MQDDYEIEKDVPIPVGQTGAPPKYPFSEMAVGDSFVVEGAKVEAAVRSAHGYGPRNKKKFVTRIVKRADQNGRVF